MVYWWFYITVNNISFIYFKVHLYVNEKIDLWSGSHVIDIPSCSYLQSYVTVQWVRNVLMQLFGVYI